MNDYMDEAHYQFGDSARRRTMDAARRHWALLTLVPIATVLAGCIPYNGGGIPLNAMQDEAWVPQPEL